MKAIKTRYRGYAFRSRLEARWAVFFSQLGLPWEYEKEGYELPSGLYLPDFWLPTLNAWVEIKPADLSKGIERNLCAELAVGSNCCVFLFNDGIHVPENYAPKAICFWPTGEADDPFYWCQCRSCGAFGIEFQGRSNRMPCKHNGTCLVQDGDPDKGYNFNSFALTQAFAAALSARFEHGEIPV